MSGQDHRRDLVAQLGLREPLAGFRVACGEQQIEQVARSIRGWRGLARPHDLLDQAHPRPLEPPAAKIAQCRDRRRQHHVEHMRMRVALTVFGEPPSHRGAVLQHLHGEHRAAGNFERQVLHGREQIDRLAGLCRKGGERLLRAGHDVPRQHRHAPRRKGWRDGAPLEAPVLALAEQQAHAGDRAEDADRGRRAAVVRGIIDQHAVDRVRRVEQHVAAAQDTTNQHVLLVGRLGPHRQRIGADGAEKAEERQFLRRDGRVRRGDGGFDCHVGLSAGEFRQAWCLGQSAGYR